MKKYIFQMFLFLAMIYTVQAGVIMPSTLLESEAIAVPFSINNDFKTTLQRSLKIYPIPATEGFVNIVSDSSELKRISVFDALGKEVMRSILHGERLDISELNSGIYIIKITQENEVNTKKLIVK